MTYTDLLSAFKSFHKEVTGIDLLESFDLLDEGACVLKTEKLENGNVLTTYGCTEEVLTWNMYGNKEPHIFSWEEATECTTDEDGEPMDVVKTEYSLI